MKILEEEYLDYLERFTELINDKILKSLRIKSIAIIREGFTENPFPPRLLVKKLDDTQYTIDGMKEIVKHLNKLADIIEYMKLNEN